jgi:lipopolysaccharide/colanic/teichoic acid biosynthesis glycosyltransferase
MFALTTLTRFVPESTHRFSHALDGFDGLPFVLQRMGAFVALVLLSPIMLFSFIAIRLESRGPAIYTQTRVGYLGRRFKIYKFRSMFLTNDPRYVDISTLKSDREGVCKKLFKDPRITRVGRVIRKLSIDELPQLLNVIQGDMLLIGPRPALPQEVAEYTLRQFKRLDALPGLTGLWQVSGRADTSFEEQMQLDIRYVEKRCLLLDLRILAATIPAVLTGRGAY